MRPISCDARRAGAGGRKCIGSVLAFVQYNHILLCSVVSRPYSITAGGKRMFCESEHWGRCNEFRLGPSLKYDL